MKSNNRHLEHDIKPSNATATHSVSLVTKSRITVFSYSEAELLSLKRKEEKAKIGLRYSFDDNGGGYQGL